MEHKTHANQMTAFDNSIELPVELLKGYGQLLCMINEKWVKLSLPAQLSVIETLIEHYPFTRIIDTRSTKDGRFNEVLLGISFKSIESKPKIDK